ncbi:MAG TPA: MCP four helix bundle domain-containing protein, partial [Tepidisphaeraceae bacterium]|nr:MCP four helix bundle domain-containing protein [Tepidisphaeraceae bacterium]
MMTFGIGKKIALGFGGLLGILLVICVLSVTRMNAYSGTLERISRENYDSVTYAQSMRDALRTLEDAARDNVLINASSQLNPTDAFNRFDVNLERGARNVTLAGEQQLVDQLTHEWKSYRSAYDRFNSAATPNDRLRIVSDELRPRADRVDALAAKLIDINLQNIVSVDGQIRQASTQAKRALYALVGIAVALAILFTLIISRSILQPLRSLTRSAHEIEQGNLDL